MRSSLTLKLGGALCAVALSIPAATAGAAAPSGGVAYADPDAPTVFADGSTLAGAADQLLGRPLELRGTLSGTRPGQAVEAQRLDRRAGWIGVATGVVAEDGTFAIRWRTDRAGRIPVRVVAAGTTRSAAEGSAQATAASGPTRHVTVYRPAVATWYGPGLFGNRTACGQRLTRKLLGVAHKTLPCGASIALFKNGRTVTVPVVDRGPFRRGTTWDLTQATARALGVTATTTVGAVRVPRGTPPA